MAYYDTTQTYQRLYRRPRVAGVATRPAAPDARTAARRLTLPLKRPHLSFETWRGLATLLVFAVMLAAAYGGAVLHSGAGTPVSQAAAMNEQVAAHATGLRYHRGYAMEGSWLCYGWPGGGFHCTQRWYRASNGALVSLNTAWVPNVGASAIVASTSHTGAGATVLTAINPRTTGYAWGQCTFGAALLAHDNVSGLGNAYQWAANARARGLPTGYTPRVGATVVFQRGVDGASWAYGHVAHVVAVSGNSFEIEAMNDVAGFGRFGFRWVTMRSGVSFIY